MNAFARMRLALTEDSPAIFAYNENAWAKLPDSISAPVALSVTLLESLHARWVVMLQSLTEEQWQRGYRHPQGGLSALETTVLLYAWHSRHHVAHITALRELMGWK